MPIGAEARLENVIRKPVVAFVTDGEVYLPLVRLSGVRQSEPIREALLHSTNGVLTLAATITNPEGAEAQGADFLGVARSCDDIDILLAGSVNRELDRRSGGVEEGP